MINTLAYFSLPAVIKKFYGIDTKSKTRGVEKVVWSKFVQNSEKKKYFLVKDSYNILIIKDVLTRQDLVSM